jgi:hypothetical protein
MRIVDQIYHAQKPLSQRRRPQTQRSAPSDKKHLADVETGRSGSI